MCHIRLKKYLYKTMQYVHSHSINILGNDKKKDREFGREKMFGSLWKLPENVFGSVELSEERNISWVAVRALLNVHAAIFIGKESRVEIVKTTKLREIPLTNFPKWSLNSLKVQNVIERHILIRVSQFFTVISMYAVHYWEMFISVLTLKERICASDFSRSLDTFLA